MLQPGLVAVDKPAGITSHDVVSTARKVFSTRAVGHGGTLDPFATGVLVLGINSGTKVLQFVAAATKSYSATAVLGIATNTDDVEGEVVLQTSCTSVSDSEIRNAFAEQVGLRMQVPPAFSAIKVNGVRAYKSARAGVDIELAPREVEIFSLTITQIRHKGELVEIDFDVVCGSGTYIRAIARDAGRRLNVGGHLQALRRTENAGFTLAQCVQLSDLAAGFIPIEKAISRFMPSVVVSDFESQAVAHGRPLTWRGPVLDAVAVFDPQQRLLAIGKYLPLSNQLGYHSVLINPLAG